MNIRTVVARLRKAYPAMMIRDCEIFLSVIAVAGPNGTVSNAQIIKDTGMEASGVSRSISALCTHSLLAKERDEENGRKVRVSVHPAERPLAREIAKMLPTTDVDDL